MELYKLLPEFTGPNMLPEERMAHFRDNIRPSMQYCGLTFLPKLMKWCDYIKEFDSKPKSMNNQVLNSSSSINHTTMTKNVFEPVDDVGCYYKYYCNVESLAGIIHALMVAMAILSIMGLMANLFCLVQMHLKHNRSFKRNPFGIYFASIIFIDCIHIILGWLLFIVLGIVSSNHKDQLKIYQTFTYAIVQALVPFWDLTCLLVTWLVIALLVQRSNITRSKLLLEAEGYDDSHLMSAKKRRKTYCNLALIVGVLFIYTIPKFAEYTSNIDIRTGKGIVVPLLRIDKLYRIIMLKFLSPSIECSIPIIVILAYIGVIKYHEAVLLRRKMMTQSINQQDTTDALINPNLKVLSAAGVSRKTQLVIWIAVLVLINLVMKMSAVFVGLEQNLKGSPKEEWPRLRQIVKYMSIIMSITIASIKPLIYIHCCPRLLRKDLSVIYSRDSTEVV